MAFQDSANHIRLEGAVLYANCFKADGSQFETSLNLDKLIGNDFGTFKWGRTYFSYSAADIRLDGVILRAKLFKPDGSGVDASLDLGANIANYNGALTVVHVPALGAFYESAANVRLEGSTLHATCFKSDGTHVESVLPLDPIIGNIDGVFKWGFRHFPNSARNVRLVDGFILRAELSKPDGSWHDATLDLGANICNVEGVLTAKDVPMAIALDRDAQAVMMSQLGQALDQNPGIKVYMVEEKDGVKLFYVNTSAEFEDGTFFKTFSADVDAAVVHLVSSKGRKIEQVNVDVLTAHAGFTMTGVTDGRDGFPVFIGVDANLSLFKAQASIFDLNLGLGVETGLGIKDGSVGVHLAGCGVTIGRKVSISACGSSFGIDFGRFFD